VSGDGQLPILQLNRHHRHQGVGIGAVNGGNRVGIEFMGVGLLISKPNWVLSRIDAALADHPGQNLSMKMQRKPSNGLTAN